MVLAVSLVGAMGYLAYRSLSSIVTSVYSDIKPDYRIIALKTISTDLEKAENNIRLYTLTRNDSLLEPAFALTDSINKKIVMLLRESRKDHELFIQIGAINNLISNKFYVWNKMIEIYDEGNIEASLKNLSSEITSSPKPEQGIIKKILNHKSEPDLNSQKISDKIMEIERQHKSKEAKILDEEAQLIQLNNKISTQYYSILDKIDAKENLNIKAKAGDANYLASKTYRWLALFILAGSILALIVIFIVGRYVRKTHAYQLALEKSKLETENLARTKEHFMANVSHEIRTPLNALSGFLDLILNEPISDEVREKLNIVKSSSDHLIHIISDILDFSKLQSGKLKLEKIHFKVDIIVKELLVLFENKAKENRNQLIYEPTAIEIPVLIGDPYRLQQIFYNLLGNAIKFTYEGEVRFSVEVGQYFENTIRLAIKVEDTGIGIPLEKQYKIFEDFTQAEPEITRKYGGTGLGLSIVKELVELHNGSIHVKSEPGIGSTFTCDLCYELGDESKIIASNAARIKVPDSIHDLKILVVDDEEYNRLLIQSIFKRWKVDYSEAVNGLEAIEQVKSSNYDLILMDARMPVVDGIIATRYIRNNMNLPKSKIPIIAITAATSDKDREKYFLTGTNAVLQKPISEERLLESILSVMNSDELVYNLAGPDTDEKLKNEIDPGFKELHRLADNDKNFILEMLSKFIRTTTEGLNSINESLNTYDTVEIAAICHKLSSPCRHLGAQKLLSVFKQMENHADETNAKVDMQFLLTEAIQEFEKVKRHISNHIRFLS